MTPSPSALNVQTGGDHYKNMKIQPVEFITANNLGFIEGNIIKYICRHPLKGGAQDLRKARHFIDMLLELEYFQSPEPCSPVRDDVLARKQNGASSGKLTDTQEDNTGNIPSFMLAGKHYETGSNDAALEAELGEVYSEVLSEILGVPVVAKVVL